MRLFELDLGSSGPTNVNISERWLSVLAGGALTLVGFSRRSVRGGILALAGASLLRRGITGHCHTYAALNVDSLVPDEAVRDPVDEVDEASDESFPASDPPSWTPTHAGPPPRK